MEFKEILKELRRERNLTHDELAKKIGFSKAVIGFWESGRNEPTGKALLALASFFEVTTDYLLGIEYVYDFKYEHGNTKLIHREKK